MASKHSKRTALVVLPTAADGRIGHGRVRAWLSRGALAKSGTPEESLRRALAAIGVPLVTEGFGALRLWGQTGDRPAVWIAAADPIHLEARLDHVRLHAHRPRQGATTELAAVFDFLQASLGQDGDFAFALVGELGYLRSDQAMLTASLSAAAIDGRDPAEFMPEGEGAAHYHKLMGEVQMCLHDNEINRRCELEGLAPVNSLWLWGGGTAPEKCVRKLPVLFADDPLFRGYWESCTALAEPWPERVRDCLDVAVGDFVVVAPASRVPPDALEDYLIEVIRLLEERRLHRVILMFPDGVTADLDRFDIFRFWRRGFPSI